MTACEPSNLEVMDGLDWAVVGILVAVILPFQIIAFFDGLRRKRLGSSFSSRFSDAAGLAGAYALAWLTMFPGYLLGVLVRWLTRRRP